MVERSLLLVDDEPAILRSLKRTLRRDGYTIHTANNGKEAIEIIKKNNIHVIVSDQRMPHMSGSELLSEAKNIDDESIRIVLSGYSDFESVTTAINQGAIYKFLTKPWDDDLIREHIREAFSRYEMGWKNTQLSKIFERTPEGIVITNTAGEIQSVNPAFYNITGFKEDEILGKAIHQLICENTHGEGFFHEVQKQLTHHGEWTGEIWNKNKSGKASPCHHTMTVIKDSKGDIAQYASLFTDISDQKKTEKKMHEQAYHDELTQLPNRYLLHDRLDVALAQARRYQWYTALLFIDLDRFKIINDTLGHDVGDQVLVAVAQRLKSLIRAEDTVARLGGDEFIILLPKIEHISEVEGFLRRLLECMKEAVNIQGRALHITPSIGISLFPEHGDNAEDLMRNADTAMYKVKGGGRNNYQFYRISMHEKATEQLALEQDLHEALEKGQLRIHYQPQFDTQLNTFTTVEALIRWEHPEKGMISPGDFIPIAEETGLIIPISQWVLTQACQQAKQWLNQGTPLRVSVNLSPRQFVQGENLYHFIQDTLNTIEIPSSLLELEVTENLIMNNTQECSRTLKAISELGITLALDDFGTGYSSLSYLKVFPFDVLKIDQAFIRSMNSQDSDDAVITRAIISMAHSLGLKVVAEGVETAMQKDFLQELQCDLLQGYYFSRPVEALELPCFEENRC